MIEINHLAILGGVAAAVAAGLYVYFGTDGLSVTKRRRHRDMCPGLENLGNTCFLNALLQALAPCTVFIDWAGDLVEKQISQGNTHLLVFQLLKILKVLNNKGGEYVECHTTDHIIRALHANRWLISHEQQDAHEMLHVLTQTLEEEAMDLALPPRLSLSSSLKDLVSPSKVTGIFTRWCHPLPTLPVCPTKDTPYRGSLVTQMICQMCGYKFPLKYDTFDSLGLSIPSGRGFTQSLGSLLTHMCRPELLSNVSCEKCCQAGSSASKQVVIRRQMIGKLPQLLCIHIQRTMWTSEGNPDKRFDHIKFSEIIDFSPYCQRRLLSKSDTKSSGGRLSSASTSGGEEVLRGGQASTSLHHSFSTPPAAQPRATSSPSLYRLASVVVHLGDTFSGHFVTYRRAPRAEGSRPGRWLLTSDSYVRRATLADVMSADAYMLFYERTNGAEV